jgi:hypothetical protein
MPIPPLDIILTDHRGNRESWTRICVVRLMPEFQPARDPEARAEQEQELIRYVDGRGMPIAPARGNDPGGPFAEQPWVQWFDHYALIEQRGGLDV